MRALRRFVLRENGSELLEFSLMITPLLGIMFLLISICWAIFARATLQFAVREGVRYAITGQTIGGLGQDDSIRSVVQQNSFGFLTGPAGAALITIGYTDPNTGQVTASNAAGNVVQVTVPSFSVTPLAPILQQAGNSLSTVRWRSDPFVLSASSADVVEPSPQGVPPSR